ASRVPSGAQSDPRGRRSPRPHAAGGGARGARARPRLPPGAARPPRGGGGGGGLPRRREAHGRGGPDGDDEPRAPGDLPPDQALHPAPRGSPAGRPGPGGPPGPPPCSLRVARDPATPLRAGGGGLLLAERRAPGPGGAGLVKPMREALPSDLHSHSEWSYDAPDGSMEESCRLAVEIGLPTIAFTDHAELAPSEPQLAVEGYLQEVERCRSLFPTLRILSGIELGQPHRYPAAADALLSSVDV